MTESCPNCDKLQTELDQVRRDLNRALARLAAIGDKCAEVASDTAAEISAGDVPTRKYEYLKAQNDLSNEVLKLLSQAGSRPRRRVKMFSGMFRGLRW